jgi:hypothetical protein
MEVLSERRGGGGVDGVGRSPFGVDSGTEVPLGRPGAPVAAPRPPFQVNLNRSQVRIALASISSLRTSNSSSWADCGAGAHRVCVRGGHSERDRPGHWSTLPRSACCRRQSPSDHEILDKRGKMARGEGGGGGPAVRRPSCCRTCLFLCCRCTSSAGT